MRTIALWLKSEIAMHMEAARPTRVWHWFVVVSSSSSDRDAFSLVPALDPVQFSALVDSHRQAKQGRTPLLVRSATATATAPPFPLWQ